MDVPKRAIITTTPGRNHWSVDCPPNAGAPAQSLELKPPTLDDVFLELTGRNLREGANR